MFLRIKLIVFSTFILLLSQNALAVTQFPFYKKIDLSVSTKEAFLKKLDNYTGTFRAPQADMLKLVSASLGLEIKDLDSFKKFVVENKDVEVGACNWSGEKENVKLSFVKINGTDLSYGDLSRECYNGEYVLKYRGKVFLSMACGNPVQDERVNSAITAKPQEIKPIVAESLKKKNAVVVFQCSQRRTIITREYGGARASGIWGSSGAGIFGETGSSMQVEQTIKTCN